MGVTLQEGRGRCLGKHASVIHVPLAGAQIWLRVSGKDQSGSSTNVSEHANTPVTSVLVVTFVPPGTNAEKEFCWSPYISLCTFQRWWLVSERSSTEKLTYWNNCNTFFLPPPSILSQASFFFLTVTVLFLMLPELRIKWPDFTGFGVEKGGAGTLFFYPPTLLSLYASFSPVALDATAR